MLLLNWWWMGLSQSANVLFRGSEEVAVKQRDAHYEFIRIISMLFVIGVHSLANITIQTDSDQLCNHILTTFFFLSNGLFFMLSGKFALNSVCETVKDYRSYYLKKLVSLGVPILVFLLLRTLYDLGGRVSFRYLARQYLENVLCNYQSGEYWFLYDLFGMLLIAPFLGKIVQRIQKSELMIFLGIGFFFNALKTYIPAMGFEFSWSYPLGGWMFYFLLGYCLEDLVADKKAKQLIYGLGIASFGLTIVQKYVGFAPGVHDMAPTYAFMVSAAFLGLKSMYRSGRYVDKIVIWISKQSMSVYLIHMVVMYTILNKIALDHYLAHAAALIFSTAIIAILLGTLISRVAVLPLQKILLYIFRMSEEKNKV